MEQSEIIKGCINGDKKCQQLLYQELYGRMMGICLRYSKDRDDALDMLQEGFIKVFMGIQKYDGTGPFEAWARRIIVNTALDAIRKNKQFINHAYSYPEDEVLEEIAEVESDGEFPDVSQEAVLSAVQELPPVYRTVFNMYVVDGITHQEIANQLGINIGTSKSNLSKAKMNLRKKLLATT